MSVPDPIPDPFPPSLQCEAPAIPEAAWDVIVIGAGPAGSMAAIHLARDGHRVLLLDSQRFPRDKPCGDGLIADALDSLCQVGLEPAVRQAGHAMDSLSIFSASAIEFSVPGLFLTLRRSLLDALLALRAVKSGAVFARAASERVELDPEGLVRCTLAGGRVCRGRFAVLATGANVRLIEQLGLAAAPGVSGFAMRCYVRSSTPLDHLVVSFDRAVIPGYAWIFPLGGQEFNVGCGVVCARGGSLNLPGGKDGLGLHRIFSWFIRHFPPACELLHSGQVIAPLKGAMLRCGLGGACCVEGRMLVVGDALGATLPFTGEGIGKAMQTGRGAARALHQALVADDPACLIGYEHWVCRDLRPLYAGYEFAQRWFARAWANDLIARRVRKSPFLRGAFAGLMNESVNPAAIFSWPAILKSFWA